MILKIEAYDSQYRIETNWIPDIGSVRRFYSDELQSDALRIRFTSDSIPPEIHRITGADGIYLCNDEGKTVEVISRLKKSHE